MDVLVSVKRIQSVWQPYSMRLWGRQVVSKAEVKRELDHGHFIGRPWEPKWTALQHAQRIAWLVVNGWEDAIEIDVGVPGLTSGNILSDLITDGNHRLAAAIYRKDETILSQVSGDLDYAFELLGVQIEIPA